MQQDQESRTEQWVSFGDQVRKFLERLEFTEDSKIFQDPDSPSSFGNAHVSHQALIPSSCKKPSRESRMQRNTLEDMSIPRSVFDCQPARRVSEEIHNNSRNSAASSGIQRREGIEQSGCEKSIATNTFTLLFGKSKREKRSCLKSVTNHAAGIGTCTQSDMTIPSYPSSEMHLGKVPDHTKYQSRIANFRTKVCSKAKNPTHASCSGSRRSKQPNPLDDLNTPKSRTGEDFTDHEKLDSLMASALKRCYDKQITLLGRRSVSKSRELRRTTDFSERGKSLIWFMNIFDPLDPMMKFKDYRRFIRIKLDNDNIQDFALRWEQALLLTSDPPSDKVFQKLHDSSQAQTILPLYNQEILRGGRQQDYHRLRMCVKLHVEQAQRSKNVQDSERDFYIRVPRGTEKHQRKKWRTHENLASSQSWITSEGGKVWSKHPLLLMTEKRTDWRQTLDKSGGHSCD